MKHDKQNMKQAVTQATVIKDVISGPLHQEKNSKKCFGLKVF
jgi:hypothetical protein